MGKTIKRIKIFCFIIIVLQLIAIGLFVVFYLNNLFDLQKIVEPLWVVIGSLALIVLDCLFVWFSVIRISSIRGKSDLKAARIIGSDVQEAYNFAMLGLVVTDDNDVVLWSNDLFKQRHIEIVDLNIFSWEPKLRDLKDNNNPDKAIKVVIDNRNYQVKYLQEAGLWIFKDNTDFEAISSYSTKQAPVVGLLSIDNYNDVTRGDDDSSDVITKLKNIIFNYAKDFGILLRRHKDDTYLLLCNYESLCMMIDDKFSILKKARDVTFDEGTPLTLSIGIAHGFPDVIKLNEMASDALNVVMSRGGDQVAVAEHEKEMIFFGGKTDVQERRNRVKVRVLGDSLLHLIKNASNVMVMGHTNLDMDALGGCLGIYAMCQRVEKDCHVVYDNKLCEVKTRGALLSQFSKEEIDKITISPYDAENKITADTLLIVVDVHIPNMTLDPKLLELSSKVVVIDHHRRAEEYIESPVFNHIDPTCTSTSELVTELIRFSSITPRIDIDPKIATIMLSGIFLDSTFLRSRRTGVRTFEACTILKEFGADNAIADDLLKDDYEEYMEINELVNMMVTPVYGVVYSMGSNDKFYDNVTIAKAANVCLSFKGNHAAFVFARVSPKEIRMSCRSDGSMNVQIIAEKLGGGGHFSMSAVSFESSSLPNVESMLKDVLNKYLKEATADAKSRKDED